LSTRCQASSTSSSSRGVQSKDVNSSSSASELAFMSVDGTNNLPANQMANNAPAAATWTDRFGDAPRKGSDVLVQALEREGVNTLFAYPGGASMEIHQALTRSDSIRNILCRHEQGEVFAAEGYAKTTGNVGVCIATSGPGATNLVTGLADAMLDSVPMVAITGQVPRRMIGTDAFQETPIVEISRPITKHNYLVMRVEDIPRIIREAFFLASSGRPGPVLVDIPKDIQQTMTVPTWDVPLQLRGYFRRQPAPPTRADAEAILDAIEQAKAPVMYVGGGCVDCGAEVTKFAKALGIPVVQTLMGLGSYPLTDEELSLGMLGMHGTVYANYAVDQADLLLAFGVRFDDRVTGKLEAFANRATIVHVDVDPAEISKNKYAHVPVCAEVGQTLRLMNQMLDSNFKHLKREAAEADGRGYGDWREDVAEKKKDFPMQYPEPKEEEIYPQWAIEQVWEATNGNAVVSTGVGQHQMFAAQYYKFNAPRKWLTSGGLGSMGFGLPAALGAQAALQDMGLADSVPVIDFDGDGSFVMNCQELATVCVEKLPVKMVILNNQHLGMVVQWEDRFYEKNRAHTYLGKSESAWHDTANPDDIYPDMVMMAKSFGVPARRVFKRSEMREAIDEMLATDGPFLLDVMVPHIAHVLPMIPGGGSYKDSITDGDGNTRFE